MFVTPSGIAIESKFTQSANIMYPIFVTLEPIFTFFTLSRTECQG